jgi:hypothetical protein
MDYTALSVKIAQYIKSPIDPNLKVTPVLGMVSDIVDVPAGERTWYWTNEDANVDDIYTVDASGEITAHKVSAVSATELTFVHLNSKKEYVLLSEVMDAVDQAALARKKAAIARSMDKIEVKRILDAMLSISGQDFTQGTDEDIVDLVTRMKQGLEDYGDKFVLLCGKNVKAKIDTYDKDHAKVGAAGALYYPVKIKEVFGELGVEVVKVIGKLKVDGDSSVSILGDDSAILVARDSMLSAGLPTVLVRRMIPDSVKQAAGIEVENAYRATIIDQIPTHIAGTDTLGFGVIGYESIIQCITNKHAIGYCVTVS